MSSRTVDRVDDWGTVPFGGGYGGLRDLASREFSGVVTAGPSKLFMIRGAVVGVLDGSIDDFEGADGTAREAPHPALPLLAVMQERSDEVRAQYYTEDTPLADVDSTLEDGNFTGFVDLSENVLSGDYYQVYHQGRSMSVAYVGSAERLTTDDEAFEQANDEVGIYEVRPVAIDAIDVPEPAEDEGDEADADAGAAVGSAETAGEDAVTDATGATDGSDAGAAGSGSSTGAGDPSSTGVDAPASTGADPQSASGGDPSSTDADDTSPADAPTDAAEHAAGADADATSGSASEATDQATAGSVDETSAAAGERSESERPEDERPERERPKSGSGTGASASESDRTGVRETSSASSASGEASAETDRNQRRDRERETSDSEPTQPASSAPARQRADSAGPTDERRSAGVDATDREQPSAQRANPPGREAVPQEAESRDAGSASAESAADLETRSLPSLDPSKTEAASRTERRRNGGGRGDDSARQSASQSTPSQSPSEGSDRQPASESGRGRESAQSSGGRPSGQSSQRSQDERAPSRQETSPQRGANQSDATATEQSGGTEPSQGGDAAESGARQLRTELEDREQELDDLQTDIERVEAERDELESARDDLEAERDRLESELEEARAEIERLETQLEGFEADAVSAETRLSAAEAIDGTNLFVRYRSKGDATLETAHASDADRTAVAENLRLEYHTQFDAEDAAVGGESFDEFLTGTISYRFVEWVVENLLYEIRDTGHADGMSDLYNALPKIDRAELNGQVSVTYTENGEEHRSQERFDVVVRDRMGNPLVVANINDSRDPATDSMMTDLVKRAERVGESSDALAGAFLVTESFFEPEALETAEEATSSGLFNREKRKSFVNLSRKDGYHLCLVEARNRDFHLAVPEL